MVADLCSARIKQIRFRGFKDPLILVGVILVGATLVDLDALGRGCEGKRIGRGDFQGVRN